MDNAMFKKMKVKEGQSAKVLFEPNDYPVVDTGLFFDEYLEQVQFVHLFVSSRQDFEDRIEQAKSKVLPGGMLWVSYPKSVGKVKYDINRDSMWDLSIPHGIHPVSQISLDDTWSALRFVENKPDEIYERPNKK